VTRRLAAVATLVAAALLLGACSDGGDDGATVAPADGGEIVLGAEQYPECLNPITECGTFAWTHWAVDAHVLPRLMELDAKGRFVPSPVLEAEPELSGAGSGEGSGPFTVTYRINENAVWDDGTPITSADIAFTWHAYLQTTGTQVTAGYDQIQSIDESNEREAVVTFKAPFADWPDLFGGVTDYVLKKAAFAGPDTAKDLTTAIPFSGGPFKLQSFSPTEAVLVRNEKYWSDERRSKLDKVTIVPATDADTAITSLQSGEIDALYPTPGPGFSEQVKDDAVEVNVGAGTKYLGIWFNQASRSNPSTPLKSKAVREALLFAIDRGAILDKVVHPDFPELTPLNCGAWVPTVGNWCGDDFADLKVTPTKVASLLEADGWKKGADGIYAKAGQRLSIAWSVNAADQQRVDIQSVVIPAVRALGIELRPDNAEMPTLGPRIGQLQFEMITLSRTASPDPSVTSIYACDQRATEANDFEGGNIFGWCNEAATAAMMRSDAVTDPAARLKDIAVVGKALRDDAVLLPLFQSPLVTAWNSTSIAGPVGRFTSSPYGGFENIYDWYLAKPAK
jgi:peptide/nickel transport system substrate-binding protein